MSQLPAALLDEREWVTPEIAATYFGRDVRTIRRWLSNGTFVDFGYEVRRQRRRVWIRVDPRKLSEKMTSK